MFKGIARFLTRAIALESSHAIWEGVRFAKTLPKSKDIVIVSLALALYFLHFLTVNQCLSGRGDKDVEQISELLPGKWEDILDWHVLSQ